MLPAMAPCIERAIAERARTQLGHITDDQLRELGVSSKVSRRLVASGWLVKVGWHTFRMGGPPPSYERDVMAACLDIGGVASHRTAARLHGLAIPKQWRSGPVEVSTRKQQRHAVTPLALVHSSTNLGPDDILRVRGVPTTSIARTILGLAALVPGIPEDDVRNIVDVAVRDGRATDTWLWWRLEELRCRGRNGVAVLERILANRAGRGRTESWLERAFLACIQEAGFPHPEVQRRIRHRGAFVARVDFLFGTRLVVEVSGHATHSSVAEQEADAVRRNQLQAAGFMVLEFTYRQVVETPEVVLAVLAEQLCQM
jgi:very-short-patch-repair endonuclease